VYLLNCERYLSNGKRDTRKEENGKSRNEQNYEKRVPDSISN
jgi:hypothetical protein